MSSASSKSSKNRRNSILKVRQTTVDTEVEVAEQQKNRRRVSFHHQKTVKEYDKEKHELSATSPLKEALREAMSDFDSTKSNSTLMSLGTPDRTTGDNNTMMLFRGMMSGAQHSSMHQETKNMSFSIIEDPANPDNQNDTLNIFNGLNGGHVSIHSKTVDISYRMEESVNENPADDTMNVFRNSANQSTRTMANMTMDMDISKADNTITDGAFEGDDTLAIFGGSNGKNETAKPLDDTMDVFTAASGSQEKSRLSQSILMDITATPSPASSQDRTIAVFGQGSQADESVAMDEATMIDEGKENEKAGSPSIKSPFPSAADSSKLHNGTQSTQSPSLDDTMGVFGSRKANETGDGDVQMEMEMSMAPQPSPSRSDSPTMNMFKRKGDDEMDESATMEVSGSKRWREDGDGLEEEKESPASQEGSQQDSVRMDEVEETMNVFGVKTDVTMDMSEIVEKEQKDTSIMDASTKTAELITEKSAVARSEGDMTVDVFNGMGDTSQMDVTGRAGNNSTKIGGDSSKMDFSGVGNETFGIFGKKEDDDKKDEDEEMTLEDVKETEKSIRSDNRKSTGEEGNSIHDQNGSADMDEVTPPVQSPLFEATGRKTRLSTVIEVSSRYTAASSQSMRQRVEGTEDEEEEEVKGDGILDRMKDETEEIAKEEAVYTDGDKSRVEEVSMEHSPSPSDSNNTFSATFTKRSMLDETRLSDRSIMNITRSFDEIVLEKIDWMNKESEEGGQMEDILREHATPFREATSEAIQRSEAAVEGLLSEIAQLEKGELLSHSIVKLNPSKVPEYRIMFEWARREAQREWWEKRVDSGENVNEEMVKKMKKDEEKLTKAKEDFFMMKRLNELRDDVENMTKEVEMGRGLSRNTIDELIGASRKKEEEKERLQRELTRMEMENIKQSTIALKIMIEKCNAVDESIKRKLEEREKNKREMRAYLSNLTTHLN